MHNKHALSFGFGRCSGRVSIARLSRRTSLLCPLSVYMYKGPLVLVNINFFHGADTTPAVVVWLRWAEH
jgi:hypothetical protein